MGATWTSRLALRRARVASSGSCRAVTERSPRCRRTRACPGGCHDHRASSAPTVLESFADPSRDPLWFELLRARPDIVDGFMAVPDAPGLGLELRADTLEKYGVKIE